MNKLKTITYALLSIIATMATTSCADWLKVDLEDSVLEDKLYENNDGYFAALNGVYAKMNETYASTLTMGHIDVMAQYYNVAKNSEHAYFPFANYKYSENEFKSISDNVWTSLYFYIANLNTLIEHCDASDSKLSPVYKPYIKGEALALRAFFHFDLLRLYGPIYSTKTENNSAIPYQETSSKSIQPILNAKQVAEKIMRDLNEASLLLKDDRIIKEGVMNGMGDDPNEKTLLRYRQFRLNYYAIQAMKARLYLWTGDKTNALATAKGIIEENNKHNTFTWIEKKAVTTGNNPNYIFSTEVMFALYNKSRAKTYEMLFSPKADMKNTLYFKGESTAEGDLLSKLTYFYDDMGDLRRNNTWTVEELTANGQGGTTSKHKSICLKKFADTNGDTNFRYMQPLMRLSEIYLIAAECATTPEEALPFINELRKARNCVNMELPATDAEKAVQNMVWREFMREMIGEGQLFFFYKRHAAEQMMSGTEFGKSNAWTGTVTALEGTYKMALDNYVWPLPEAVEANRRAKN